MWCCLRCVLRTTSWRNLTPLMMAKVGFGIAYVHFQLDQKSVAEHPASLPVIRTEAGVIYNPRNDAQTTFLVRLHHRASSSVMLRLFAMSISLRHIDIESCMYDSDDRVSISAFLISYSDLLILIFSEIHVCGL